MGSASGRNRKGHFLHTHPQGARNARGITHPPIRQDGETYGGARVEAGKGGGGEKGASEDISIRLTDIVNVLNVGLERWRRDRLCVGRRDMAPEVGQWGQGGKGQGAGWSADHAC